MKMASECTLVELHPFHHYHHLFTMEYTACDDEDHGAGASVDSIQSVEATRRVLVRSIKDPIHDYIPVHTLLSKFIDTRHFQRLRDVKQLGTSSYVWPGATHTRFEHSLGVAYLSRVLASQLQRNQPELNITDRDVDCVEIAGLCHDLGHGPWSHVWDGMFIPRVFPEKEWRHEQGSEMMLDSLISDYGIPITEKDQSFIKALIAGDPSKCSAEEKRFLFDIVANKRNGLDVDKFDYILRDTYMIGEPIRIDSNRIVNSARVIEDQICYDIKDANQLYEICATRFKLHKMIYNHKAAKAIEYMIIDALLAAEPYLRVAERVFDPEKFIFLNDSILNHIECSIGPELARSRAIVRRIRDRELYKMVDFKSIEWPFRALFRENVTSKRIVQEVQRMAASDPLPDDFPELKEEDVIVDLSTMHHGMKEENPLKYVKFYSKRNPSACRNAEKGDYSTLQPDCFAEVLLRIYTKKPEYWGRVQAGYRQILDRMSVEETTAVDAITPPATEPPSTPPARTSSFSLDPGASAGPRTLTKRFSNNNFTTVDPSYSVPKSPTRGSFLLSSRLSFPETLFIRVLMSSNLTIDYGAIFGIHSVAAAVIFIIIYAPLAIYYIWRVATRFNYVFIFLTVFCVVRVAAFAIRAAIAGSDTAGTKLGLVIADQILFGMGFSGLLFSTYSLQNDRERIAGLHYKHPLFIVLTNRRFYHLIIVAAIVLVITGTNMITSSDSDTRNLGNTLRTAGTWILFGVAALQALRSAAFVHYDATNERGLQAKEEATTFGDKHAAWLLILISAFLLWRMIYSVITIRQSPHEATYYPLSALPEFLCVCVYAVPGLVLSRRELKEKDMELERSGGY
ncbi:hypothetical protein NP233_g2239 [Leucocoprinus birnbaumii]|uniref:HD domain-containing protein n=1 Tax=Leucocoprinus birnbaumii TaxID=56174 RepID=A0AAD5YV30_9AGAR|nr:hypothetical protein NP233_g2239 [Leucocoprinus birnbaumii]